MEFSCEFEFYIFICLYSCYSIAYNKLNLLWFVILLRFVIDLFIASVHLHIFTKYFDYAIHHVCLVEEYASLVLFID